MKKAGKTVISLLTAAAMLVTAIAAAPLQTVLAEADENGRETGDSIYINQLPGTASTVKSFDKSMLSATGYVEDGVSDRSCYYDEYVAYNEMKKEQFVKNGGREEDYVWQNTANYMVANNEQEFCAAIAANPLPKVIEVAADLNLGYKYLEEELGIESHPHISEQGDYSRGHYPITNPVMMQDGVSKLDLVGVKGLTIYSQNGNTIRHCELQFDNCSDIVVRNLSLQCMNEWDDHPSAANQYNEDGSKMDVTGTGNRKRYDWDIITVYQSQNVWIDHCTCGIAYDGTIDMSDAVKASVTWCEIGVLDEYGLQEMKSNMDYMEDLYKEGKGYVGYAAMRDAGATAEQVYEFAEINDKVLLIGAGDINYEVNIYDRGTFAYCYIEDSAQRVPQIVSGSAHMFNCWVDCMDYQKICQEISTARTALSNAGISALGLCRANSARGGAALGTDTCVFEGVINPIIGSEHMTDGVTIGAVNHNLIVNSSTQRYGSDTVYVGSSWDNNGENPFLSGDYWVDKESIDNFTWALWKDITKTKSEASDTVIYLPEEDAEKLGYGEFYEKYYIGQENLDYQYQLVPLSDVKQTLTDYAGADKVDLTPQEWLSTEYTLDENGHKVVFQFDGSGQNAVTMNNVADGTAVALPEATEEKTGYHFDGWYTKEAYGLDENGNLVYTEVPFTAETEVTADTTVYAKWAPNTYTLTLEPNGGTSSEALQREYVYGTLILASDLVLPDLVKEGCLFDGWYKDEALKVKFYSGQIKGDMTLYAKWKEDTTPVKYGDANSDGSVDASDALKVLRYVVGLDEFNENQLKAAKVSGDENISANDALLILKYVVGLITAFPAEQ